MSLLKIVFVAICLFVAGGIFSQPGIKFEKNLSWNQIKEKARQQDKYIFVDAFTTWCGPCIMMSKGIFPLPEVGEFHNRNFINVKAQLDTTGSDSEEVKMFYADAREIRNLGGVVAFPTFLYFNSNGELVHKTIGSSDAESFLSGSKQALDSATQYYTLKSQYRFKKNDTAYVRQLLDLAREAYDQSFSDSLGMSYLSSQATLFTSYNLRLLEDITDAPDDKGFTTFLKDGERVDGILGEGRSADIVKRILQSKVVYPAMYPNGQKSEKVDWTGIEKKLNKEYPAFTKELLLNARADHFLRFSKWQEFSAAVNDYILHLGKKISPYQLNDFAWSVFQKCDDKKCLESALKWSAVSLTGEEKDNSMLMDTYANLLYKLGRKEEAIAKQQEAVRIAEGKDDELNKNLQKMQKGEKTW